MDEHALQEIASPQDRRESAEARRRALVWAMLIALMVFIPRGMLIVRDTSETVDDPYHLSHGLAAWSDWLDDYPLNTTHPTYGGDVQMGYNDPPLGAMLLVVPFKLTGATLEGPAAAGKIRPRSWEKTPAFYGQPFGPEAMRQLTGLWKIVLFLPGLAAAFLWVRDLFGARASWLALAVLLVEPNLAAHLPPATVDTIGLSAILVAAYAVWRYAVQPTPRRLVLCALAIAVALLCKHTAVLLPAYAIVVCLLHWLGRDRPWRSARAALVAPLRYASRIAAAAMLTAIMIWPLTLFDVSAPERSMRPVHRARKNQPAIYASAEWQKRPLPAGIYVGSFIQGRRHANDGHGAYLFGERATHGWWYYFPVVATYKVPVGHLALVGLGGLSLLWVRVRTHRTTGVALGEASLLLGFALWGGMNLLQSVNIGFRHALPAYAFALLWACRVAADPPARDERATTARDDRRWTAGRCGFVLAWVLVGASGLHALTWHPNYVSYINLPRHNPHLDINDSNIEWGQSVKQVRRWIDRHPTDRTIWVTTFGAPGRLAEKRWLGDRVRYLEPDVGIPDSGILILNPIVQAGIYEKQPDRFEPLRNVRPIDIIADSVRVYDLDALAARPPG